MRANHLVPILAIALAGCSPHSVEQAHAPPPEVSSQEALQAISDLHLMSLHALYETIGGGNPANGRLTISMSDEANLATGRGRFRIDLSHYALPTTSPLAGDYNGYVVTGVVDIDSQGYAGTFGSIEVALTNADPRRYPVQRIELLVLERPPAAARMADGDAPRGGVAGSEAPRGGVAGVRLFVNGRRMPGRLLLGSVE